MTFNKAYLEAERKIEEAQQTGALELDLRAEAHAIETEKLIELPESLGQLTQLRRLILDNNQLRELPASIRKLTQLQELYVDNNQLTTVVDWLGELSQLLALTLDNNRLTILPESLCELTELKLIAADNNWLTKLPESLGRLTQLQELSFENNRLTKLPESLGQLTQLKRLLLGDNRLTKLPESVGHLTQLQALYLRNNKLIKLPESLGRLTQLQELSFKNNQLTVLPESLGQLIQLQELYLDNNELAALPESFGQLIQLQELYLDNNELTALSESLGQLNQLRELSLNNNPLPNEILRLAQERQIIAYLWDLVEARERLKAAPPRTFNEAKLLLVGQGNVGKTWLLQALLGNIPQQGSSTKGLEIARVPLDFTHPTQKERTLHLNCWDFGGQDHYQITHQIFFSPKAIYLLVWKPRHGVDPELEARLERIKLSAGQTAKVFIVSTYAEGNVPAILGEDALHHRFPDLIQGFYAVDSANGPNGTGIAELRAEIAKAAAQLEGMDTPFPDDWHQAQKAVRALNQTTLTLREFVLVCVNHGMKPESCESLASIMDVQGNAVFFDDAPRSREAGVEKDDNLVVLDPEWLAKAVTFVIEDEVTRTSSGVLVHKHLHEIWKEDKSRDCPGYDASLFGFLLWMMWKFDIAYNQNDDVSLVPELIHRNRPDNLRWIPADRPRSAAQATLICRIPQDPPVGLIPALTAAVHPLRRIQNPEDILDTKRDKLDRNWRDGFFLDTELRGTAYVELIDRDLHIVVRDDIPKHLCLEIRKTLDIIKNKRWPRLHLDYRVPCIGRIEDKNDKKPCTGTFKWDYLDPRRGKQVPCQHCNNDELDVDNMLEGFNSYEEEILRRLQQLKLGQAELKATQADLIAGSLRLYRDMLDPARWELERAPNMFTISPETPGGWEVLARATENRVRVTCWCEHPDGPHVLPVEENEPPNYVLTAPKDWLKKVEPFISWSALLLKAFVPVAGSIAKVGLEEAFTADLKTRIDMMSDVTKAIPTGRMELGRQDDLDHMSGHRPEIVALRHIHDALLSQVSEQKRWGDLRPVRTKSGDLLWLCAEHAARQQPPVQDI